MSRLIAFILFFLTLSFYTITLQPALAWGDGIRLQREVITAESFILAEMVDVTFAPDPFPFARLGIAAWDHPLYVIIGHLLVQSVPAVSKLWLVNFLSALFGAGTIALLFTWCYTHTRSYLASTFAALFLAVSHTFWWHAVTPEVYTLFTFLLLLTILCYEAYERSGQRRMLYASFFTLGLSAANHLLALLIVPAFVLSQFNMIYRRRTLQRRLLSRYLLLPILALLLGFAPYLIQFLRLLRTFPLAQVMGPAVGITFLRGSLALSPTLLAQSALSYLIFLLYQFGPVGLLLGLYGWAVGRRATPLLWRRALALYVVYVLFGLVYRVSDQFAFFMSAHLAWAIAMSIAVAHLLKGVSIPQRRLAAAGLFLLVAIMPAVYTAAPALLRSVGVTENDMGVPQIGVGVRDGLDYYLDPNKRGDTKAYHFGRETLQELPPQSLVIAQWYVDTDEYFVLRYFAAVEGMRPDVEVAGWPAVDPFTFKPEHVLEKIEAELPQRPVYLASLSDDFYAASQLVQQYCVVPESQLYRVYARHEVSGLFCLANGDGS